MGFSLIASTVVIGVSILLAVEILTGNILPAVSDINDSYKDMKNRAVEQVQTDINITGVTKTWANVTWWDTDWSYRKRITINHIYITSDLTNFPIMVDITDSDLKDKAQSDGDDITFVDENNIKLNHEIEMYDSSTGHLIAWVNVTHLYATVDTIIYIYYGNPTCSSQQNPAGTWDSNFVLVQHLSETSNPHYDSTQYNNDGNATAGTNQSADGIVDGADSFQGQLNDGDYVAIPDSNILDITGSITMEAWVKITDPADNDEQGILSKPDYNLIYDGNIGDGKVFRAEFRGLTTTQVYGVTTPESNSWYYVVGVYDSDAEKIMIYVDGDEEGKETSSGTINTGTYDLRIGNHYNQYYIDGTIDEVRISKIVRSAAWIKTTYYNINLPNMFLTVGTEEDKDWVYLIITVENIGSTNLEVNDFTLLINGTVYEFTGSSLYLYPEDEATITTTTLVESGVKRVKVITYNGIADYYEYTG